MMNKFSARADHIVIYPISSHIIHKIYRDLLGHYTVRP